MESSRPANPRDRIAAELGELYPGRADELLPAFLALASAGRAAAAASARELGSGDAILIAYGDMLRAEGRSPLTLLGDFVRARAGAFSYLHILPFFPSSSDEGFSVMDYLSVDADLGSWDDVSKIGKDIGLAFDLVLNHSSAKGGWFGAFLEGREPYRRFFATRDPGYDASKVFRPRTHPLFTEFRRADGSSVLAWTTFSADQVDLDFSEPEVLLAMAGIALLYAERGASILRLDAVAFAWKDDGTNCLDRPRVHSMLRLLRALVDEAAPGLKLLSETNLPREINDSYFGRGDEAHLVYNFPLPPLALHAFMSGKADCLASFAARQTAPGPGRAYVNFLSSHDGIGVTPARDLLPPLEFDFLIEEARRRGALVSSRSSSGGELPYELNTTFLDAIAESGASDVERTRAFLSCHAAMAALAGVPAIWFHSLVGSRNWAEGPAITGSKRSISRRRLDPGKLERELSDPSSMRRAIYEGIVAMLAARAARPAFDPQAPQLALSPDGSGALASKGSFGAAASSGPIFGLLRGRGEEALLALANVSGAEASCAIPAGFEPAGTLFDPGAQAGGGSPRLSDGRAILPARGALWIDGRWKEGISRCT